MMQLANHKSARSQAIAESLLSGVEWLDDLTGFCQCPGESYHTHGTADRASFGRNSKVLQSWTRAQINVAAANPDDNETLTISCGKCSNGREFAPFAVKLNQENGIYEIDPHFDMAAWQAEMTGKTADPIMSVSRVFELCGTGKSKKELSLAIIEDCGCVKGTSYKWIQRAISAKKIMESKANGNLIQK